MSADGHGETQNPREFPREGFDKAGDDLLSRYSHYHGPQVLNGRVRNGNGCGHLGMVTGKTHVRLRLRRSHDANAKPQAAGISKRQRRS